MENKRRDLRRHIKAATDWLQQADQSIEREEDVQGDLKLMLAKAELKNAEKHQNHSLLIKFLSIAAAVIISFVAFQIKDSSEKLPTSQQNSTPSIELNNQSLVVSSNLSGQSAIDSATDQYFESKEFETVPIDEIEEVEESKSNEVENNFEVEDFSQSESRYEPIFEEAEINSEQVIQTPVQPDRIEFESKTPTEDMQKLMQSAGQILRAE